MDAFLKIGLEKDFEIQKSPIAKIVTVPRYGVFPYISSLMSNAMSVA